MAAASWCRAPKRFGKMHGPPPGVLRDPHAAAARSRRGGREPSVCRVTARCHGESSGDPGAPAPKAPCAFGGGGGRGRSSRSLDVETPPGLTEGGELKSSGERSRGQRGRRGAARSSERAAEPGASVEVASLGYYKGPNEDTDDGDQAKPKRVQTAEAPGPVELGCTTPLVRVRLPA